MMLGPLLHRYKCRIRSTHCLADAYRDISFTRLADHRLSHHLPALSAPSMDRLMPANSSRLGLPQPATAGCAGNSVCTVTFIRFHTLIAATAINKNTISFWSNTAESLSQTSSVTPS